MAVNSGVVLCLRRVFVSNVMSSCRAKREVNFCEYEKQILFRAKLRVWSGVFWMPRGAPHRSWMPGCAGKTVEGAIGFSYCLVSRLVRSVIMGAC